MLKTVRLYERMYNWAMNDWMNECKRSVRSVDAAVAKQAQEKEKYMGRKSPRTDRYRRPVIGP